MLKKETLLTDYLKKSEEALTLLQKKGYLFLESGFIWQILIYELEYWDVPTQVLFHNLSTQDIVSLTQKYFHENGLPVKNILVDDTILPYQLNDDITKARVKLKGEIWTIHKNDVDPFPSSPHAHNYEHQYKLHLGNGELYRKTKYVTSIKRRDLLELREKIIEKIPDIKLPEFHT